MASTVASLRRARRSDWRRVNPKANTGQGQGASMTAMHQNQNRPKVSRTSRVSACPDCDRGAVIVPRLAIVRQRAWYVHWGRSALLRGPRPRLRSRQEAK